MWMLRIYHEVILLASFELMSVSKIRVGSSIICGVIGSLVRVVLARLFV